MSKANQQPTKAAASVPTVTVRREIEASAEELFDAWLDPESAAEWMRPNGIVSTEATIDARVGGAYAIVMHTATKPILHSGVYKVIDRPRRLVFTWTSPSTHELESLVTVEFHARAATTEIVLIHTQLPDADAAQAHTNGWTQALARLADFRGARA